MDGDRYFLPPPLFVVTLEIGQGFESIHSLGSKKELRDEEGKEILETHKNVMPSWMEKNFLPSEVGLNEQEPRGRSNKKRQVVVAWQREKSLF